MVLGEGQATRRCVRRDVRDPGAGAAAQRPARVHGVPPELAEWAEHLELSRVSDQTAAAASSYLRGSTSWCPRQGPARTSAGVGGGRPGKPAATTGTPPAAFLGAVLAVRREREQARLGARQQPADQAQPGTKLRRATWVSRASRPPMLAADPPTTLRQGSVTGR